MMDDQQMQKLIAYVITQLRRSNTRQRRIMAPMLYFMRRRRRQIAEHRNFLFQETIRMYQNISAIIH